MTTSYQTNDPRGWGGDPSRGAALGRATIQDEPIGYEGKLAVDQVEMDPDDEAYDINGTYWGLGNPLWWIHNEDGTIDYVIRARNVEAAGAEALGRYPRASLLVEAA
jgi:hypothetical protein